MNWLFEFASKTPTLVVSFLVGIILLFFVFPNISYGDEMLDMKEQLSLPIVLATLENYGESGRNLYLWVSPTLDTIFPVCYGLLFAGLIYRFSPVAWMRMLAYVGLIAGLADLLENIQLMTIVVQFPDISESQVTTASLTASLKLFLFQFSLLLALVSMILSLVWRLRAKK